MTTFPQCARAQIDRAVQEIQRERVRIEVGGTDVYFTFSHRQHAVQDVGQGRVQRTSGEGLPASDLAVLGGPVLAHETDALGFLKDRQR